MASNIDVQKVIHSLGEAKMVNLDMSLRDIVDSRAVGMVNEHAHLEPWDLICYTWITYIRRRGPEIPDLPELPGGGAIDGPRG